MKKNYSGVYAALVTPYDSFGQVSHTQLRKLVRYLINKGIDGFYVGGSTAEAFLLSDNERRAVLETVVSENNGARPVISHVGAISTDTASSLARFAERCGADAISAISPFYYKFSKDEIAGYYLDIMAASSLPMFVYNFPNLSGFALTEDVLDTLRQSPTLMGVKFTSSDFFLMERIKTKHPELIVWNGFDEMLLSGLIMGADGGIGSTYNCMAPLIRGIYSSFRRGNIELASALQRRANTVIQAICRYGVFPSVKTILSFEGIDCGGCRRPFRPISEEGKAELRTLYETYLMEEYASTDFAVTDPAANRKE